MNKQERNPLIRVLPQTRKKLKMIAAYHQETMQEAVERIAEHELKWIEQQMILKAERESNDAEKGI